MVAEEGSLGRARGTYSCTWGACALVVLGIALGSARPARAQVLCPSATYTENALAAELTAAVDVREGNAASVWAHEALCGRLELGQHWAALRITHAFGRARVDGETSGRFVHALRMLPEWRYRLRDLGESGVLRSELLVHYERDELRRIDQRVQPGAGLNLMFMDTDVLRLGATLAYVFEYQRIERGRRAGATLDDSGAHEVGHRVWGALDLGWDAHERVFVGEELIAQLPVDRCACATRLYAQTQLRVEGTEWLSLELSCLLMYDPRPAETVDTLDVVVRSGLVFTL